MECILDCGKACSEKDSINNISQAKWENIKKKAMEWTGLDKFGETLKKIRWQDGYQGKYMHRSCYLAMASTDKLSKALIRFEKTRKSSEETQEPKCSTSFVPSSPPVKRTRRSLGILHNKNLCVWCMKPDDNYKHPDRNTKLMRIERESRWLQFKRHVPFLEDVEMRRRISCLIDSTTDPFASDILYHKKCWTRFIINCKFDDDDMQKINLEDARKLFFRHLDEIIFKEKEIRTLQGIVIDYKRIVGDYGYNVGEIKSSLIKELLIKEYGHKIGFKERLQKNQSEWVYDAGNGESYVDAVLFSSGITDEQLIQNASVRLRASIDNTSIIEWPPKIDQLEKDEEICELLLRFLSLLRNPSSKVIDSSPKTLVSASLLIQYVTGKRTNTSINLGVDLHGHTRNKSLIDNFHKAGLTISYVDVLLLYDKWALENISESMNIPCEIACNTPTFCIVDNDDFKVDTLTGNSKKAHRTNVMYVQPVAIENKSDNGIADDDLPKTKQYFSGNLQRMASIMTQVTPYRLPRWACSEPPIRPLCELPDGTFPQKRRTIIHALARIDAEGNRPLVQQVPSYSGMQACLNPSVGRSKAYYQATYPEPPTKSVMYEIMLKNVKGMAEKNIPFLYLVGDLPTYVHIVELKAENTELFKEIVPVLGPFHQQCSFIYTIYKRFKGSGIADVLVSAGVIVEGSVDHALKGKHYRRGVRCIMLMRESLIQSRIKEVKNTNESTTLEDYLRILRSGLSETRENLVSAHDELERDKDLIDLVCRVYNSTGTDMGDFWLSFLEMTDILVQNIHACHIRDLNEYLSSTYDMLPYLLAYNNNNYGRWLPDYWASISSLSSEKYSFFEQNFTQSITGLPYSLQGMDLWIECTMNLGSKLKQGWLNLLDNEKQLLSTTRNVNNIARVRSAIRFFLKKKDEKKIHAECQRARMKKDEAGVRDIEICLKEFETEPFDSSNPVLRTLQSAIPASNELTLDFKKAIGDGKKQLKELFENRIYSKYQSIRSTIPKKKRLDFLTDYVAKGNNETMKQKANQMEKNGLLSIVALVERKNMIDLVEIMKYRITEESLSVFNVDGSMRKTQKSKITERMKKDPVNLSNSEYISVIDMGFLWRISNPTPDDRDVVRRSGRNYTWGDYANKVVSLLLARHSGAVEIFCVNDVYNLSYSIKDDERERRSANIRKIQNVTMKQDENFPTSSRFKAILQNSNNKIRLQNVIESKLREKCLTNLLEVIQCTGTSCKNLLTGMMDESFSTNQAEADTAIFTIYSQLRENGWEGPVVIDAEDTDVYIQACYVSNHISGDLYVKHKNFYFDCNSLVSPEIAEIIIQLHVLTGCDHNSGFYGHGKKSIMERVIESSKARSLLMGCGNCLPASPDVINDLKTFVLKYIYRSNSEKLEITRSYQWKEMKKKNTQRLVPDNDTLTHICERTNYLAFCGKHFRLKDHPEPIGHGWDLINGKCRPIRYTSPALPLDNSSETLIDDDERESESSGSSDISDSESSGSESDE